MHCPNVINFQSRHQLIETAVHQIASHILDANENARSVGLFLSGGSTPGPVYQALAKERLPWDAVKVGLVDERWASEDSSGSNAALIRTKLLQGHAKQVKFTSMKTSHSTPQLGQESVEDKYREVFSDDNLAVLGMGTDGHVCSWFPNSEGVEKAVNQNNPNLVQAITAKPSGVTGQYLDRMTLTYSALAKCKTVLLLITGDEKKSVLETAMSQADSSLPVRHLFSLSPDQLIILQAS